MKWQPTPVLWPGKSHGWRSLGGYSPWGLKELDMTERPRFHYSLSCIGEGNGNPLQCSCLENPRDGGAWWAAVYGVTQSWTWLKRLSSSSSSIGFGEGNGNPLQYSCLENFMDRITWRAIVHAVKKKSVQNDWVTNAGGWVAKNLLAVKETPAMQEMWVRSLGWKDPLEKEMATSPVFLSGKSHGQKSLEGYSPWGRKESNSTEVT